MQKMKQLILLVLSSLFIGSLYARPMGKVTDGTRVVIVDFGYSIKLPAGMKTELKGKKDPLNYRFPWFKGNNGFLNFAIVNQNLPQADLTRAFDSHINQLHGWIKYTGKSKLLNLPSGIKSIRAEFEGSGDAKIVRYYFINHHKQLCYVHLLYIDPEDKSLETAIQETIKQA